MCATLGLTEAARNCPGLRLLETRESFGDVKIEVIGSDDALNTEEVFESTDLSSWIFDETLAADEMEPIERKPPKPALKMTGVQTDTYRAPRYVDRVRRDA